MDMQRTEGHSSDELRVVVVDENPCHARATETTLVKLNFQAMAYTSPMKALDFLKDHEKDVDFVLVAVQMKEMHGFQFLDISREMHKNLQVIMMSTETTWPTMQRCVELGARFLVNKPLDTNTIKNIWQHLDLKLLRMEKIKHLFQGIEGKTNGVNSSSKEEIEKNANKCGEGTKKKTAHLMWTPFLQKKFLHAIGLLGEAATPKKIELIMNVNSIDRKQISAHLQKHRKRMEKELRNSIVAETSSKGASSSEPLKTRETGPNDNTILPGDRTDKRTSHHQTEIIIKETHGNSAYEAMRKALQLGTVFDESLQFSNDPYGEEAKKGEADMTGDCDARDDSSFAFGESNVLSESHIADNAKEITNMGDYSDKNASSSGDRAGAVKLVTYSDSEDDEEMQDNA